MILRQIDDIVHEENRIEFLFQKFGIRRPDPERNDSPRIPENRISDLLVDLGHILIRQHEIEVVFPGFGKDIGKRFRREVAWKALDIKDTYDPGKKSKSQLPAHLKNLHKSAEKDWHR
jgi:hypothetical protein